MEGATRVPRGRGRAQVVVRALDPRGQVLAPPDVFSVPDILKYSRKNHIKLAGHLENFYFWGSFIFALIIQKTDRKYYFCFI